MTRLALGLLALCGCDLVLSIDEVKPQPAACGPYATITPVVIVGIDQPKGFSISADEQLALVTGKDSAGITRPIPLRFDGTQWTPDPALQGGLVSGMRNANLAPDEPTPVGTTYTGPMTRAMMLSSGDPSAVARYYFDATAMTWRQDTNQTPFNIPNFDPIAGDVVLVAGTDPGDRVRHTVITEISHDGSEPDQITITANSPPSFTLKPKPRTDALDEAVTKVGQAVLTDDKAKLVYSAQDGGNADIFAAEQDDLRNFGAGPPVVSIDTDDDEVEPWVNATCSKLYFRRVPAGLPNAAGQIYVAE